MWPRTFCSTQYNRLSTFSQCMFLQSNLRSYFRNAKKYDMQAKSGISEEKCKATRGGETGDTGGAESEHAFCRNYACIISTVSTTFISRHIKLKMYALCETSTHRSYTFLHKTEDFLFKAEMHPSVSYIAFCTLNIIISVIRHVASASALKIHYGSSSECALLSLQGRVRDIYNIDILLYTYISLPRAEREALSTCLRGDFERRL